MCEKHRKGYKGLGQEIPDCEYKGNKSKIQSLIRKVHIDAANINGSVTEVPFDNKPAAEDAIFEIAEWAQEGHVGPTRTKNHKKLKIKIEK